MTQVRELGSKSRKKVVMSYITGLKINKLYSYLLTIFINIHLNKLPTVVCKLYKIRPQSNLDFQGGANATVALLDVTIVSSCLKREPIPFKHRVEFEYIFEHSIVISGFEKKILF